MKNLDQEIALYDSKKIEFESKHMGEWVLIHESEVVGFFNSFEIAANVAVPKFGSGPYLIRQVGAKPFVIPVSVAFKI